MHKITYSTSTLQKKNLDFLLYVTRIPTITPNKSSYLQFIPKHSILCTCISTRHLATSYKTATITTRRALLAKEVRFSATRCPNLLEDNALLIKELCPNRSVISVGANFLSIKHASPERTEPAKVRSKRKCFVSCCYFG